MSIVKLDQIFKEFIHVVQENPNYTIGLLDKNGRVISCGIEEKIGKRIDINQSSAEDHFYKIIVNDRDFGYLWVNSQDESVAMVGNLLSESLKTRIIYEWNQESARKSLSVDDQLIKELIDENNFDLDSVVALMKKLNFDSKTSRVAIVIINNGGFDREEITGLKYKINEQSTIYSLLDDEHLLVFKRIPEKILEGTLREHLNDFIVDLQEWGLTECHYFVGTVQKKVSLYSTSYNNCLWLSRNIESKKDEACYFEDFILNYFASNKRPDEIANLFDYYNEKAQTFDIGELINIADHLYKHDYNVTQTAESLFLHKNTLIYKIKRYEEVFDLDLRGSFQGKILFYLFANFLKENIKRKQVGAKL